ncbi:MAG: hypothetical protein HYV93_03555 [Candidatus Rokubacteria bacterium]|nr:hypothetical protein [Candidatus Rokubacteria bacterium]
MPTYEYECQDCSRVFEARQRISEPALTTCDKCGGPVRRLIGAATFILKGKGWYVTDYPSEARKKAMKSEASSTPTSGADAQSSTAAKSDSASSAAPAPANGTGAGGGTSGKGASGKGAAGKD